MGIVYHESSYLCILNTIHSFSKFICQTKQLTQFLPIRPKEVAKEGPRAGRKDDKIGADTELVAARAPIVNRA